MRGRYVGLPVNRRVRELLSDGVFWTVSELAQTIGCSETAVRHALERMRAAKVVEGRPTTRGERDVGPRSNKTVPIHCTEWRDRRAGRERDERLGIRPAVEVQ